MKNTKKCFLAFVLIFIYLAACTSMEPDPTPVPARGANANNAAANASNNSGAAHAFESDVSINEFTDAFEKDLKLIEVQIDSKPFNRKILYDRNELNNEKIGDIFTLKFGADTLSGKGAPNQYSAPYTRNEQTLEIKTVRSSLMAPIIQPEKIQESAYFMILQNTYEWNTENGKFVLLSKMEDGSPVKLIFSL